MNIPRRWLQLALTLSPALIVCLHPRLLPAASSWDGKAPATFVLDAETDRPDAMYHVGEKVTFNFSLQQDQHPVAGGSVDWVLSKDGVVPPIQKGNATLKDGKAAITGQLDEPGFLHCEVTYKHDKEAFTALAAAAIDPLKIKPSMPVPADFDAFWAQKKKDLAAVPINPRLTPVPVPPDRPGTEAFGLQADCIGKPVSGYYARPIGVKPKSCPARVCVPGSGVRSADLLSAVRWAGRGVISLDINAHGIPNGKPDAFYAALETGELKNYRKDGNGSRDTYYFLGAHLRTLRALEFLTSQPEWDGRTLMIEGGSQGGGLAIAGAALDPRVTFFVAANPALCDHTGMTVGRIAGWPKVVPVDAAGRPDPAALEAARYFDSVNFATRIRAGSFLWEGFLDVTCPPTGVFAAFNQLPEPKHMTYDPSHGHGLDGAKLWPAVADAQTAHITAQTKK